MSPRPIVFGIPTLSGAARVESLIRALPAHPALGCPLEVHVVDNGGVVSTSSRADVVHRPARNLGVAASWNVILRRAAALDAIAIIANDDIVFAGKAINRLARRVVDAESTPFLVVGPHQHIFSFFAVQARRAIEEVGLFDEQFYPAYWEDNDYEHRMRLRGLDLQHVPHDELGFAHDGRRTSREAHPIMQAWLRRCYLHSRTLYVAKWGGCPPRGELFEAPYDATKIRGKDVL